MKFESVTLSHYKFSVKFGQLVVRLKKAEINALFVLILGIHITLLYCTLTNGHDWADDFSQYIMQTQSIVEGKSREFIEVNRFTIQRSCYPVSAVGYPWGFPVLLAPVYAIFGNSMIALKSVAVSFFMLFLFCLFFGFRKYHSPFAVLILICLFALNPYFLWHLNQIMSDIPFLVFSSLAVLLMGEVIISRRRFVSATCDNIVLGVVIFAACSIRTTGVFLLLTLVIAQFISLGQRISWREIANGSWPTTIEGFFSRNSISVKGCLIDVLPYASCLGLLFLWNTLLPEGGLSYTNQLSGISASSIEHNLLYYIKLPAFFFTGPDSRLLPAGIVFYVASLPCVIIGALRRYRADYHIIVYVILTVFICIIWPAMQGLRFLFPVLPFYLSFMLTGLGELQGDSRTAIRRPMGKIVNLSFVVLFLLWLGILWKNPYFNGSNNLAMTSGPFTTTSKSMFTFINQSTEPDSTVVFFRPRLMRLMTGRRSLLINKIEELPRGDYLCLYRNNREDQVSPDAIRQYVKRGVAQLVYENSDFKVYRLVKGNRGSRDTKWISGVLTPRKSLYRFKFDVG